MARFGVAIGLSVLAFMIGTVGPGAAAGDAQVHGPFRVPASPHVYRVGLDAPGDVVSSGDNLFVSNVFGGFGGNGSVTELNAATGAVVRAISGPGYDFNGPNSLALRDGQLFVANAGADVPGSVTELSTSTGKLVRVISGTRYGFQGPGSLVLDGQKLFVLNSGSYDVPGSVTELNAATGALVRVISGAEYRFSTPYGMALSRGALFVSDSNDGRGGWLTDLDAATGTLIRIVSDPAYRFVGPGPIAADGTDLFVLNRSGSSVTEFNAFNGNFVRVISSLGTGLTALAVSGTDLYVAGGLGAAGLAHYFVKEVEVSTGSPVATIAGPSYDFSDPEAILPVGTDLVVVDSGSNAITEFPKP